MGERRMYRYEIPVDDQAHVVTLTGEPLAFAATDTETVEFWAEHDDQAGRTDRAFRVVGTGHVIPDGARWVGTCPRHYGLVWHLYEVPLPPF